MALFTRLQSVAVSRTPAGYVARGELSDHLYNMSLKLAADQDLVVTAVEGRMIRFTTDRCSLGLAALQEARGLKLDEPDFESQARKVVGRPGCRHLAHLLVNAARSVIRARDLDQGQDRGA